MTVYTDLANRLSPTVKDALTRPCELCGAAPGVDCTNLPINGHALQGRIVHYGRTMA